MINFLLYMKEVEGGNEFKPFLFSLIFSILIINSKVPRETKVLVEKVIKLKDKYPQVN